MTNAARDERERGLDVAPTDDWTRTPDGGWLAGPAGLGFETILYEPDTPMDITFYTREQGAPDEVCWTPITDPAEIATIEAALAQGIDPPYEVWVDQTPAALAPGDLTPIGEGPTVYAWEQTGPAVGEGQLYEVTDPVLLTAYAEAHPEPSGVEIANPGDYYEAASAPSHEHTPALDLDRDLTPALDL